MSFQITEAFVEEFKQGITILAQQDGTRLREGVSNDTISGKRAAYDQISATVMEEKTGRHTDTPLISTPHAKRWVLSKFFEWADLIDDADRIRILNDPASAYVQNAGWAAGRTIDQQIIAAYFGTAVTGEDGTGSASFDTTNFSIANSFGSGGAVGLTVKKLREAARILRAANNRKDNNMFKWYIAVTAQQLDDLLGETEVTSADFNSVKALVNGEIDEFLGIKFLHTEELTKVGNDRYVPVWVKNSMKAAFGKEPMARISERDDKSYSMQAYYAVDVGSTRMDETGVVRVLCTEP